MKTITLKFSGMTLAAATTTMVTKVINPEGESSIVVDAMRGIQISLGGENAKSLGIEVNSMVTLSPIDGSDDGSFTLAVQEKKAAAPAKPTQGKGSSPSVHCMLSNDDI